MKALLSEARRSVLGQPVASALTGLIVAGMVLSVVLTAGRAIATEQQILASIDDVGTRSIEVRAEDGAGVTADALGRIDQFESAVWILGFSSAIDVTNSLIPGGNRVPLRTAYGPDLASLQVRLPSLEEDALAYLSEEAAAQLGLATPAGSISSAAGTTFGVGGPLRVPAAISSFEPLILVPSSMRPDATISHIVVIADAPENVAALADGIFGVLAPADPSRVTIETSETLAQLRTVVGSQLSESSRGLIFAVVGVGAATIAFIQSGLVLLRRKDFGRRRALGASRGYIVKLGLAQTLILSIVGAVIGASTSRLILAVQGDSGPDVKFTIALIVVAVFASVLTAVVPAVLASLRDPVRELRVP